MERIAYFLRCTLRSLRQSAMVQLVAVSTIAVSTLIFALFLTLLVNLDAFVDRFDRDLRLLIFVKAQPEAAELQKAVREMERWPGVVKVSGRTQAEALSELRAAMGDDSLFDGVSPEVLPASVEFQLEGPEAEAEILKRVEAHPLLGGIDEVQRAHALMKRLSDWRAYLQFGALGLGGLVAFAFIFIISNTIRLTLFARREELEIMQLVGATHRFIRIPCYLEGAFQGGMGAALGLLGFYAAFRLLGAEQWGGGGAVRFLPFSLGLAIALGAMLVGVLGSFLAATRYLQDSGHHS